MILSSELYLSMVEIRPEDWRICMVWLISDDSEGCHFIPAERRGWFVITPELPQL